MTGKWISMGVREGGTEERGMDYGSGRYTVMKGEWVMGLGGGH